MTTINYTGFNSPASNALRKASLIAEANKAFEFADFINSWGPHPQEDEDAFNERSDRWQKEARAKAEQLMEEAEAI